MGILDNPRLKEPLLGRWTVDRFVGSSLYSKVYKVHDNNGNNAAIKIISFPDDAAIVEYEIDHGSDDGLEDFILSKVQNIISSVKLMIELTDQSDNIIPIIDYRAIQRGRYWDILIVMEYGVDLKNYLASNGITTGQAIQLMRSIASVIDVYEKNGLVHSRINCENVFMLKDSLFKLSGSLSTHTVESQKLYTHTFGHCSLFHPEVYKGLEYDTRLDIYSLGILLYRLFNSLRMPFVNEKTRGSEANKKRVTGEKLPPPENAPQPIADIILKCCEYRPEDRYRSAKELIRDIDALSGKLQPFELAAEIPMRRKTKNAVPVSWDLLIQREYKPKYDNIQAVYASPVTRVFRCKKCRKEFTTSVMGYADPNDQLCPDCELNGKFDPRYNNVQTVYASPVTRVFRCKKCRKEFTTSVMGYADPNDQLCPDCDADRTIEVAVEPPANKKMKCRKCKKEFVVAWKGTITPQDQLCPACKGVSSMKNIENKENLISHISLLAVGILLGALISFAVFLIKRG